MSPRSLARVAVPLLLAGCAGRHPGPAVGPGEPGPAVEATAAVDPALRAELLALRAADQEAREGLGAAAAAGDTAFLRRVLAGDSVRTARLKAIVGAVGWPSPARVGTDGAAAAWLLLQHTPDHAWQAAMLPVLEERAAAGELPWQEVALLSDRVLVRSGRPQRYGNSFSLVDGRMVADPIEDPDGLEARRAAVGLPPMREYARALEEAYGIPVVWPPASAQPSTPPQPPTPR